MKLSAAIILAILLPLLSCTNLKIVEELDDKGRVISSKSFRRDLDGKLVLHGESVEYSYYYGQIDSIRRTKFKNGVEQGYSSMRKLCHLPPGWTESKQTAQSE